MILTIFKFLSPFYQVLTRRQVRPKGINAEGRKEGRPERPEVVMLQNYTLRHYRVMGVSGGSAR